MYQGFYNLASGMLTQSRNLNVISNNMVNVQTAGYKSDTMVSTTFGEEMLYRTGRQNKGNPEALASVSKIKAADRTYVSYEQGSFEQTGGIYDFSLAGNGFFCIQTARGERYTRNGSFCVDEEGYLALEDQGRVLSADGQPIQIQDENFRVDSRGNITSIQREDGEDGENVEDGENIEAGSVTYGRLKVVDFADYGQLRKEENGLFSSGAAPRDITDGSTVVQWQSLERSNVDMVEEMTAMMSSQRALQSAAQALKMYDQVMSKAASDVGRL